MKLEWFHFSSSSHWSWSAAENLIRSARVWWLPVQTSATTLGRLRSVTVQWQTCCVMYVCKSPWNSLAVVKRKYCCCVVSLTGNNSHLTWLEIQIINRHCKIGQIDITGLFLDWFVTDFRQLIPFTWQQTSQWGTYLRKVHRVTSRGSWCHWSRDKWKYLGYF